MARDAPSQNGKRTIMSGIVRRQPMANGQQVTGDGEAADGYVPAGNGMGQHGQQVQSTFANPGPPGSMLNNTKIAFHPTGPARQSQLQPQ